MKAVLVVTFIAAVVCIFLVCLTAFVMHRENLRSRSANNSQPSEDNYNEKLFLSITTTPVPYMLKRKVLILQVESYNHTPEYTSLSRQINEKYANTWGYSYILKQHEPDEAPPYWLRVKDVKQHLPDFDIIMYLDLDAVVKNQNISVENLLQYITQTQGQEKDIIIGEDTPGSMGYANTGVFLVRNTSFSRMFVDLWYNSCFGENGALTNTCQPWKYSKENGWECKGCAWGGLHYEQGSFDRLASLYKDNISVLPSQFLSNKDPKKQCFVLHLYATSDMYRKKIFEKMLKV